MLQNSSYSFTRICLSSVNFILVLYNIEHDIRFTECRHYGMHHRFWCFSESCFCAFPFRIIGSYDRFLSLVAAGQHWGDQSKDRDLGYETREELVNDSRRQRTRLLSMHYGIRLRLYILAREERLFKLRPPLVRHLLLL